MTNRTVTLIVLVLLLVGSSANVAVADCKSPTTTFETNQCAAAEYEVADAELNRVYKKVMAAGDEPFRKRLQAAQRAWLAFRDAHVAAMYPPEDRELHGSARTMCTPLLLKELTVERTKQLKAYLGRAEGDLCSP